MKYTGNDKRKAYVYRKMVHEFFPYPGVKVPVIINGKEKGYLLKIAFELDCDYPLNHKILVPDLINRPVEIHKTRKSGWLLEPERLARYQEEGFKLKYVRYVNKKDMTWVNEIFYKWKWIPEEERKEDYLELSDKLYDKETYGKKA